MSLCASQGVLKLTKAEKDQRTEAAVSAAIGQVVAFERQLYGKRILCAEDMFDALDRDKSGACGQSGRHIYCWAIHSVDAHRCSAPLLDPQSLSS